MSLAKDLDGTPIGWDEDVVVPLPSNLLSDEPLLETDLHLRQMLFDHMPPESIVVFKKKSYKDLKSDMAIKSFVKF